ncbi:MAG: alpha/beta fold hydrolase, partial [Dehalococcoidia bacterium]
MSRRQFLRSAVLGASGLATLVLAGCDDDSIDAVPTATLAPTAPPSGTFDSNGVPIHYEVIGEGDPIVLVHGFSASFETNWGGTGWVDALRPLRKVVGLDARGHGESGKPHEPEAYADDEMANDVIRLLDHLGIERADLFGYSMGAGISLNLLVSHPERFTSVIMGGIGNFARFPSAGGEGFGAIAGGDDVPAPA